MPIPLGRDLRAQDVDEDAAAAERALRASVEHAFAHPDASRACVREHAQEMSDDVCRQHIELYVNDFTIDLGDEGLAAVERLLQRAPADVKT